MRWMETETFEALLKDMGTENDVSGMSEGSRGGFPSYMGKDGEGGR